MSKKKKQPYQIPEELQKKFDEIKSKVDKFQSEALKKFGEYIIGITLLPPKNLDREREFMRREENRDLTREEEEAIKNHLDLLILVDDNDSKKTPKFELREKIIKIMDKTAEEIDKNLKPIIKLLTELKEDCYDAKYEILQLIAISAIIYDPKDMLSAIKVAEVHKGMVLKKFDRYIVSYVAAGSLFRGDKVSNDIDVYIIVDDTDVKRMSRFELKEKLRNIIITQGYQARDITGIQKQFHIQTYILTDFWDAIKDAQPVMFTFLRDGIPLYDRGIFMPWKLLLEMGRIKPSPEAIDQSMDIGERLLERVNNKFLGIIAEDLYYAVLNSSQAALMLYGLNPPTPNETVTLMKEIFVNKEKLLDQKYIEILEKLRKYYKDIEHFKLKQMTGVELDSLIKDSKDYIERVKKLFNDIEKRKTDENILDMYDACMAVTKDVFSALEIKNTKDITKDFKEKLVDENQIPEKFLRILKDVIKAKNQTLTKAENERIRKDSRIFIKSMIEFVQRHRGLEVEKAKIRFKHGDKLGEIILLEDKAFIVDDVYAKDKKVTKAKLLPNGSLDELASSNVEEMNKELVSVKIPDNVFIKQPIFDDLKQMYGKDVEILISY